MFVKFPIEIFERDAFQNFSAQQEFSLGNGRALMWVSQLAYQIEDVPALNNVLDAWGFVPAQTFLRRNPTTVTTGLYGVRDGAVIVAAVRGRRCGSRWLDVQRHQLVPYCDPRHAAA